MLHSLKRRISKTKKAHHFVHSNGGVVIGPLTTKEEMLSFFDQKKALNNNRLGNFFMILGPHETSPNDPSLLFTYPYSLFPYSKDTFRRIANFCYPQGMRKKNKISDTIQDQFVFCMNVDGNLLFGFCTHFYAPAPNFLSIIDDGRMFCMCTISECPLVSANFQFHQFLVSLIIGTYSKAPPTKGVTFISDEWISLPDDRERIATFSPQLVIDKRYPQCAGLNVFGIPTVFISTVDLYMRLSTERRSSLLLSPSLPVFIIPPSEALNDLAAVSLSYLFSTLSVVDIVRYLRSLLLEQRIMIIGSQLSTITFVVLASIVLVSPLSLKSSLLPILPDDPVFLEFLGSPVPYVFGVLESENLEKVDIDDTQTIITLDDRTVYYPDNIPHMPYAKKLREELNTFLEGVNKEKRGDNYWTYRKWIGFPVFMGYTLHHNYFFIHEQTEKLFNIFHNFVEDFVSKSKMERSRIFDKTDPNNPSAGFVKEAYLSETPPEYFDFFDALIGTQAFNCYFNDTLFD